MRQVIPLDSKDNIATIRDKLERVRAQEVVLEVPRRYPVLQNKVNLRLLQRYARHQAVDLVLVTRDSTTRVLAKELGMVVTSRMDKARRIKLDDGNGKETPEAPETESDEGQRPTSVAYASSPSAPSLFGRIFILLLLLGGLGLLALGLVYVVLPSAQVHLVPRTESLEAEMEIAAITGLSTIDYNRGAIPAQTVSIELESTGSIPTTGKRDIPDAHAEGSIVIANRTNQPVSVPQGTILRTSTGTPVSFYTVTELELPPEQGQHGRVGIIAVEAGPQGNVRKLTINQVEGELASQVHVLNDEPTVGGGLKRVNEVTAEDQGRLKNAILRRVQQEAYAKLQGQLEDTQFIPGETVSVEVAGESYDQQVGDAVDVLNMKLSVRATGVVVGGEDANTLVLGLLENKVPPGYELIPESLRFEQPELLELGEEEIRIEMRALGTAVSHFTKTQIYEGIRGKTVEEAVQYLESNWDFAQPPSLDVQPEWVGRVPWIPYRIQIDIDVPAAS